MAALTACAISWLFVITGAYDYSVECGDSLSGYIYTSSLSVTFLFNNTEDQDVTFTNCHSDFDTTLHLYDDRGYELNDESVNYCDGDDCTGPTNSAYCSDDGLTETFTMANLDVGTYTLELEAYGSYLTGAWYFEVICEDYYSTGIRRDYVATSTFGSMGNYVWYLAFGGFGVIVLLFWVYGRKKRAERQRNQQFQQRPAVVVNSTSTAAATQQPVVTTQYQPQPVVTMQYQPQPVVQYQPQPVGQYQPQPVVQYQTQPVTAYSAGNGQGTAGVVVQMTTPSQPQTAMAPAYPVVAGQNAMNAPPVYNDAPPVYQQADAVGNQ